jgi:DNA-binding transcriptional LysR family regulator
MYERVGRLIVHAGLTETHATALLTRQIDCVIGVDEMEDVSGLERWPLFEEPYLLLYPEQEIPPRDTQELRDFLGRQPFIRFSQRSRTGAEIERFLRRLRIDVPFQQEFDLPYGVYATCRNRGVAITTPLCLYEAGYTQDCGLLCHPLPAPAFHRRLTLVVRRREFGRFPLDLALFLREQLKQEVMPALGALFPAFVQQMRVLN